VEVQIIKGNLEYLEDCKEALLASELGGQYFSNAENAKRVIIEGFERNNIYVALAGGECVGFMYYIPNGAFHSFPYLHIIAIKEAHRSKSIGKQMLDFLEKTLFEIADKIFLVTADFNPGAIRFYKKNGYRQVGEIPNLYRMGIVEYLFMKDKEVTT
jgi:ribosomal protein S18 acetylase RimI-like enzyme